MAPFQQEPANRPGKREPGCVVSEGTAAGNISSAELCVKADRMDGWLDGMDGEVGGDQDTPAMTMMVAISQFGFREKRNLQQEQVHETRAAI